MALPSPTALVATVPYTKFTTTAHIWVPTIASMAAPTLAEFNAGKLLTPEITMISGFDTQVAELANPKAGTSFAGTLPGRETPQASTIEFELSTAGPTVDARSVFSINQLGYVVFCNEGIVTGGFCDIWPVRVGSPSIPQDLEQIAKLVVDFHPYKAPQRYVAIPTA
jgi:hypothetical protein